MSCWRSRRGAPAVTAPSPRGGLLTCVSAMVFSYDPDWSPQVHSAKSVPRTEPKRYDANVNGRIAKCKRGAMRQAVIIAPTRFEVVDAPAPQLRSDGDVLVRTAACGICSGDLMPWYRARNIG